MSKPLLVTLDDGGYSVKIWKRKGMRNRKYGNIALHCAVAHILGRSDVRVLKPPKGYPPQVTAQNISKVLEHETLHHIMADILEKGNESYAGNNDTFDNLLEWLQNGHWLRKRFLPGGI